MELTHFGSEAFNYKYTNLDLLITTKTINVCSIIQKYLPGLEPVAQSERI